MNKNDILNTNPLVASALLINQKAELVSNIDRERLPQTTAALQFFITETTRANVLRQVYLPNDKPLVEYLMAPFLLHDPLSNTASFRNRTNYVICNMNENVSHTDDDMMKVQNNSPYMFKTALTREMKSYRSDKMYPNEANAIFGGFTSRNVLVPTTLDPNIVSRHNKASQRLVQLHRSFKERYPDVDLGTFTQYRKMLEAEYEVYQNELLKMYLEGLLSVTVAQLVSPNSLQYAKLANSGSRSDNPYYDAESVLKQKISRMPSLNMVFGFADIHSDIDVDPVNPDLQLGHRKLSSSEASDPDIASNSRSETVRYAEIADTFGNKSSILLRRQDQGYVNTRGGDKTLSQIFFDTTNNNDQIFFVGRYTPTVSASGMNGTVTGLLRPSVVIDHYIKPNISKGVSQALNGSVDVLDDSSLLDDDFEAELAKASQASNVLNDSSTAPGVDFQEFFANEDTQKTTTGNPLDPMFEDLSSGLDLIPTETQPVEQASAPAKKRSVR